MRVTQFRKHTSVEQSFHRMTFRMHDLSRVKSSSVIAGVDSNKKRLKFTCSPVSARYSCSEMTTILPSRREIFCGPCDTDKRASLLKQFLASAKSQYSP